MDEAIRQLLVVENVSKRLTALASSRGIPEHVSKQLHEEATSLNWAFCELQRIHLALVLLVIGDSEYVQSIEGLQSNLIIKHADNTSTFIAFEPEEVLLGRVREYLVSVPWDGDKIPQDKVPGYILCQRYFASCEENDLSKRAVLFECAVSKKWLTEIGYNAAKAGLDLWVCNIFKAIDWNKAKPIGGKNEQH